MKNHWKIISSQTAELGRFEIIKDKIQSGTGDCFDYSYITIKPGVCILPIYNDNIVLIKQYRHTLKDFFWEFPAGIIDENEQPVETAKRELHEETGLITEKIIELGITYPSIGSTTEKIHLFFAICEKKQNPEKYLGEDIDIYQFSKDKILSMIMTGKINHAAGIVAFFKYLEKK
jgi:ADP-ribose pyrophosphatase